MGTHESESRENSENEVEEENEHAYEELFNNFIQVASKNKKLRSKLSILSSSNLELEKCNEELISKTTRLENEIKSLLEKENEKLGKMEELENNLASLEIEKLGLEEKIKELSINVENLEKEKSLINIEALNGRDKEKSELQEKVKDLNKIIEKFTLGTKNLNLLLGSQRYSLERSGIGYKEGHKDKLFRNSFVKAQISFHPFATCNYCNKKGHIAHTCPIRNGEYIGKKVTWVPKGTMQPKAIDPSKKGPKLVWVPKSSKG